MQPTIVSFMASHVDSERRLALLRQCLDSWDQQLYVKPPMYASWSASTPELAAKTRRVFGSYAGLVALERHEILSQFQHYDKLCQHVVGLEDEAGQIANVDDLWVLFSDDDDIWCPTRTALYDAYMHRMHRSSPAYKAIASIVCNRYARQIKPVDDGDGGRGQDLPQPDTPRDVDRLLREGKVVLVEDGWEYWQLCVRIPVMQAFFHQASQSSLRNPFADLRFASFVRGFKGPQNLTVGITNPICDDGVVWAYFYRQHCRSSLAHKPWAVDPRDVVYSSAIAQVAPRYFENFMVDRDDELIASMLTNYRRSAMVICSMFYGEVATQCKHEKLWEIFLTRANRPLDCGHPLMDNCLLMLIASLTNHIAESMEDLGLPIPTDRARAYKRAANVLFKQYLQQWRDTGLMIAVK